MDAQALVGGLVPSGSVFEFLAEHRQELFPDSFIADLFPSKTGRPSLPADLIGSVLVLKELYDLSDPQTAEALRFDIRWKVACGRSLSQTSFDPSTLVYWRKRIAESDRPDRVFDAVAAVIADTGVLRGRRKRCVDSTVFDDAVATQDTVTQLVAAMRKVARLVPGAASVIGRVAKCDYSKPGKPGIDWDDPAAKQSLVSDLVNDALDLYPELNRHHATLGIPWLHAPGNHDIDFDVSDDAASLNTYRRTFGPDTVAWEMPGHAFIALDDKGDSPDSQEALVPNDDDPPRIPLRPSALAQLQDRGEVIIKQVETVTTRLSESPRSTRSVAPASMPASGASAKRA